MIDPNQLIADLKASVASDENKLIITELTVQTVRITTLAFTDPAAAEREMAHVRAIAANLAAEEAIAVQTQITAWVSGLIRAALLGS